MRSRFSSLLAIPALCSMAVPASAAGRIEQKRLPMKAGSALEVATRTGSIAVEGWDRDEIAVAADIRGPEGTPVRWDLRATPEGMKVEAQVPQNASCSFKLHVPARVNGRFRTGDGAIEAAGLQGDLLFTASDGALAFKDLGGRVQATTTRGAVVAKHLRADFHGSTTDGAVALKDIAGAVDFRTTNGALTASRLDGRGGGIALKSANGGLDVDLGTSTGRIHATTTRPNRVVLKRHDLDLEHREDSEVVARIRGSDQLITLETRNGDITIR